MHDTMTLLGAETVERAANAMVAAARIIEHAGERISLAAEQVSFDVDRLQQALQEHTAAIAGDEVEMGTSVDVPGGTAKEAKG
jgi:hypothetical protein